MASQPQPLRPALPCASPPGAGGTGLAASSPEKGSARPKPPVRPKPRVLPKPTVPAKPSLPQPPPAARHPRPELPSAEKMNRLAGPQPYSGGSAGGPLRRPSFTLKSPETPHGKGLPSSPLAAAEELGSAPGGEVPPAPLTPSRKGSVPFKVTPVPVAAKLERFPGTTVEEILAKMDSREGLGSPDRARLSPFCPDSSSRFGSKAFAAFRRHPSGEAEGTPPGEACQAPQPTAGELGTGEDRHPIAEMSGSPRAGPGCAGDPRGCQRPPSPPDLSSLQPGTVGPPGSPRPSTCPAPAPGAPFQPAEASASAPGSPDAPPELLAPGSPTLAPGSPESPAQPPAKVLAASIQAPGAPSSSTAEPRLGVSRAPGSPHTPGEGSPNTASPPGTPKLPPRITCPPGSPEATAEYPGPPSPPPEPPTKASRPPGSPEGPDDSPMSPQSPRGLDFKSPAPSWDSGLRDSLEGALQPPAAGQGEGELRGSLSPLPHPRDPLSELPLGSSSGWSLSQSFEWTFPSRGARRPASPPCSPLRESADAGLSEEGEPDGDTPAPCTPCSRRDSGSKGPGPAVAEGAPCPGGPVAQREAEGSAEEEEEEEGAAEQEATVPCSHLCVTELDQDPAQPEPPAQPSLIITARMDPDLASPGPAAPTDSAVSLQGPGGPGRAEGPSRGPEPHADPGWLTELLASPGAHSVGRGSPDAEGTEDLLGWSRKDLCSEFGIGRLHRASAFDWDRKAVARERDWPGQTEQDQEFRTKSSWDSTCSIQDGDQQDGPFGTTGRDWGSDYKGTELMEQTRLICSDWSKSHGVGDGCPQDRGFGAGKSRWDTGYSLDSAGSREEPGSGKADWSSGCGVGHGQQQDEQPSSRQPSWAGPCGSGDAESRDGEVAPSWAAEYGPGDAERKDRELSPNWASSYSSRDAATKDKDLTLGWAGRCSTGDTGSPDKEFSPSRSAWDSKYSSQDMESQDREFSPSRPAKASEHSSRDEETRDEEFTPSRSAWDDGYSTRDMESQDREFSPSRPAEASELSSGDTETRDRDFTASRSAWDDGYSARDMETRDEEFAPSRSAWDDGYSARDMETRDEEFTPSRSVWDDGYSTRDVETHSGEFSTNRSAWTGEYSSRDMESQDREFSPSRPAKASEHSSRDEETRDEEFTPSRSTWGDGSRSRDMESQDREFSPSRPAKASECCSRDVKSQDREFTPSSSAWDDGYSTGDMDTRDEEFSTSRSAWGDGYSTRDMESQDREFSPSRLAEASEHSSGDMETQDRDFTASRSAWDDGYGTRDMETRDEEFTASRSAWDDGYGTRDMETRDEEFTASRSAWDDEHSTQDMESQDRGFSPGRPAWPSPYSSTDTEKEGEFGPGRLSWAGERSLGQTELVDALGVRKDLPGSRVSDPPAQQPDWGSTDRQERGATGSRDWAEELGGAECHNQFGIIGTERVPDPSSARASSDGSVSWAGGARDRGLQEPLGDWHRDLSFSSSGATSRRDTGDASGVGPGRTAWDEGLGSSARPWGAGLEEPGWSRDLAAGSWSVDLRDAEATHREWASAFGARCAARSRDFSAGEQSPGGAAGSADRSIHLSDPSLLMGDTLADPLAAQPPQSEPPSPTTEERDPPEPAAALPGPGASPLLPEAPGGTLPGTESREAPLDHPDGKRPPSWEEKHLSLDVPQPEGPEDQAGQEFTFLEDTEVLDSSMYRSKASLGRKRRHRAPALRPGATSEGDSWIFQDSTEPRPARPASSDEEAVEEPKSRRVRGSPSGRGVKMPLFPGLSTSAFKAKLRGRNRSAEEGAALGDSKSAPPKDPHVQRSKSCKIPSVSGKPTALPPKPEKSSGSDASPPHWLQALKLKKKKP